MKVDPKVQKRRLVKDIVRNSFAYTLSSFAILSLVLLLSFVFFKGYKYLNPQFLFGDYNVASTAVTYTLSPEAEKFENAYLFDLFGTECEKRGVKKGQVLFCLRAAITGVANTPGGATEMATLFGKEETLRRLDESISRLN